MAELKPCPCGETPDTLHIVDNGQGGKWANASGSCCNEWSIEFRTQYFKDGDALLELATERWNEAPRATSPPATQTKHD